MKRTVNFLNNQHYLIGDLDWKKENKKNTIVYLTVCSILFIYSFIVISYKIFEK